MIIIHNIRHEVFPRLYATRGRKRLAGNVRFRPNTRVRLLIIFVHNEDNIMVYGRYVLYCNGFRELGYHIVAVKWLRAPRLIRFTSPLRSTSFDK